MLKILSNRYNENIFPISNLNIYIFLFIYEYNKQLFKLHNLSIHINNVKYDCQRILRLCCNYKYKSIRFELNNCIKKY